MSKKIHLIVLIGVLALYVFQIIRLILSMVYLNDTGMNIGSFCNIATGKYSSYLLIFHIVAFIISCVDLYFILAKKISKKNKNTLLILGIITIFFGNFLYVFVLFIRYYTMKLQLKNEAPIC